MKLGVLKPRRLGCSLLACVVALLGASSASLVAQDEGGDDEEGILEIVVYDMAVRVAEMSIQYHMSKALTDYIMSLNFDPEAYLPPPPSNVPPPSDDPPEGEDPCPALADAVRTKWVNQGHVLDLAERLDPRWLSSATGREDARAVEQGLNRLLEDFRSDLEDIDEQWDANGCDEG